MLILTAPHRDKLRQGPKPREQHSAMSLSATMSCSHFSAQEITRHSASTDAWLRPPIYGRPRAAAGGDVIGDHRLQPLRAPICPARRDHGRAFRSKNDDSAGRPRASPDLARISDFPPAPRRARRSFLILSRCITIGRIGTERRRLRYGGQRRLLPPASAVRFPPDQMRRRGAGSNRAETSVTRARRAAAPRDGVA